MEPPRDPETPQRGTHPRLWETRVHVNLYVDVHSSRNVETTRVATAGDRQTKPSVGTVLERQSARTGNGAPVETAR